MQAPVFAWLVDLISHQDKMAGRKEAQRIAEFATTMQIHI